MADLLSAIIRGLSFGSVYALLAIGLVLTYKTAGVFNLAYGPQAFAAAAIYYDTHIRHGWPYPLALFLAVFVASPLVGLILDRVLFRHLRTATEQARLVTTIGLLVALPEVVKLWFGVNPESGAVGIVPNGSVVYHPWGGVFLNRDDIAIIATGILAFVGLTLLFRYTALGLRMRAVVESARMTELAGVNADRVSMGSWMLSSALAGLAGVLLGPVFGQIDAASYTTLVVAAISASVLGSLTSIPLAFAGGLFLGVSQQILARYLPTNSVLSSGLRPALPFIALFVVLVFSPALRNRRPITDPLAGVDPPPPAAAAAERGATLTRATRAAAVLFLGVTGYYLFFHANGHWVDLTVRAAILAVIFCSIVVMTGMAGQISLCQATFAAIGACATGQLATRQGVSVLVAMVVGAAIAAVVGALVAIPALRLGGIFLSLATFAFALFFDSVMLGFDWVGGGVRPIEAPRPLIGSIDFSGDRAYLVLSLLVLTIVGVVVILVRNGTTGRYLAALRGSEVAATSIGINPTRARIVAFALSAAIAGLGGGLMASYEGAANVKGNFEATFGLAWIVIVVTLAPRTVEGAIQAAIGFVYFQYAVLPTWLPWLVNHIQPLYHMGALPGGLQPILFGLGALTYAKHPEGILEVNKRASLARIQRIIDKRKGRVTVAPAPAETL